jgi:hypothetical protein
MLGGRRSFTLILVYRVGITACRTFARRDGARVAPGPSRDRRIVLWNRLIPHADASGAPALPIRDSVSSSRSPHRTARRCVCPMSWSVFLCRWRALRLPGRAFGRVLGSSVPGHNVPPCRRWRTSSSRSPHQTESRCVHPRSSRSSSSFVSPGPTPGDVACLRRFHLVVMNVLFLARIR